jgi:hypothetical protein
MELADVTEAERSLARNRQLVVDLGQPALLWATMHHDATLRALRDEPDAEAAIIAATNLGETVIGGRDMSYFTNCHWICQLWERGRVGELEPWIREEAERTDYPLLKSGLAYVLIQMEQTDEAARIFDDLAATGFAHPTNNVGWLMFMTELAWVCARLGREDCVAQLRASLTPYADQLVVAGFAGWVFGPVSFHLGLLATTAHDWSEADRYFAAAAATQQRIVAPVYLARTRVEWARMLLARAEPGDDERASGLLDLALGSARDRGLAKLEHDVVQLLGSA